MIHELRDGDVLVSTDRTFLDLDTVPGFPAGSYWAAGVPPEVVERPIRHAICFGAFASRRQGASVGPAEASLHQPIRVARFAEPVLRVEAMGVPGEKGP